MNKEEEEMFDKPIDIMRYFALKSEVNFVDIRVTDDSVLLVLIKLTWGYRLIGCFFGDVIRSLKQDWYLEIVNRVVDNESPDGIKDVQIETVV